MGLSLRNKLLIVMFATLLLMTTMHSSSPYVENVNAGEITTSDGFVFNNGSITGYVGAKANVVIPSTINGQAVTTISYRAFAENETITQITLSEGITHIKAQAFYRCKKLESISIPSTVTSIEDGSLSDNEKLSSIALSELNTYFILGEDNVLYNADKTELIQYIGKSPATTFTIPDTVTTIHDFAFGYASNLNTVDIPSTTTNIGIGVFHSCYSLTSINVDISNPNFMSQSGILFTKDGKGIKSYPANRAGTDYTISSQVEALGFSTFQGCKNLNTLTLGDNVSQLSFSLLGESSIQNINVSDSNSTYSSLDGVLASKDGSILWVYPAGRTDAEYIVPNNVTCIGGYAFFKREYIQSVVLHEGVNEVGTYGFYECPNLAKLEFQGNIINFHPYAITDVEGYVLKIWGYPDSDAEQQAIDNKVHFIAMGKNSEWTYMDNENGTCDITDYLGSDTDVGVPSVIDGLWVSAVNHTTFDECSEIEYITFYESVSSIEVSNTDGSNYLFEDCISLREIYLPSSLNSLESNGAPFKPFKSCISLVNVIVDEDNESYYDNDGVLFSQDKTLLSYPSGRTATSYSIPSGTTSIYFSAFENIYLKTVTVPGSVSALEKGAEPTFKNNIVTVNIDDGVQTVEDVFSETTAMDISFPSSVTSITGFEDADIHTFYVFEESVAHVYAEEHSIDYVFLCLITFDSNGGSSVVSQVVPVGSKVTKPTDVSREGYIQQGWFTDEDFVNEWSFSGNSVKNSMTLYSKWIEGYPIIYHMNGGVNNSSNPDYYVAGNVTLLKDPTKSNYTFDGWYTDSSCSLKYKFEAIEKDATGKVELWADWWVKKIPTSDNNDDSPINKSALSDERRPEISFSKFPDSVAYMKVGQEITVTGRIDIKYAEVNEISVDYSGNTEKLYKYQDGNKRISYFNYKHTFIVDEIKDNFSDKYEINVRLTNESFDRKIPIYKYNLVTEIVGSPRGNLYMNNEKNYELRSMAIASDSFEVINATYKSLTPEIVKVDGKKIVPLAAGKGEVQTKIQLEDDTTITYVSGFYVIDKTVNEPSKLERELMCQCYGEYCSGLPEDGIHSALLELIEKIREESEVPVYIIAGYRCPEYSRVIGADGDSEHVHGTAADIWSNELTMDKLYEICDVLNENGGVGKYMKHIHIDTRGVYIRWED